jgi:hypothetical protein
MRVEADPDGRLIVTNVLLHGPRVTADVLRKIQPARVEATLNLAVKRREDAVNAGSGTINILDWLAPSILAAKHADDDLTLGELRGRPPGEPPSSEPRHPLKRPDGSDPERFYAEVAAAYRSAAVESKKPAAVLANEAGVPVTTVHRWIREARRRGSLPAGQRGVAG